MTEMSDLCYLRKPRMQLYPLDIMHNSIQFTDVYLDEFELNTNNPKFI